MTKIKLLLLVEVLLFALGGASSPAEGAAAADKIVEKIIEIDLFKNHEQYQIEGHKIRDVREWHYSKDCKLFRHKVPYGAITDSKHRPLGFFSVIHRLKIIRHWDRYDPVTKRMTGGSEEMPRGDIRLEVPYIQGGKFALVYDASGKKLLTIDIQ